MNLVVVGLGYVGLPLAMSAAKSGHIVSGYDINKEKISDLKSGKCFIPEISMEELIKLQSNGQISFTSELVKKVRNLFMLLQFPHP